MLEKVIADRVWAHLKGTPGAQEPLRRFGFRAGRLVMDTIDRVIIDWLFLQYPEANVLGRVFGHCHCL